MIAKFLQEGVLRGVNEEEFTLQPTDSAAVRVCRAKNDPTQQ